MRAIGAVEVLDQRVDAVVRRLVEQPPVQAPSVGPLALLGELRTHEQELLAGVGPLEGEIGPQVGQLLPPVAGHLAQQRPLAMNYLVVADRQNEVLAPRVDQREGHLMVVVLPMHRLLRHVVQRVMHPAHVPLEPEAQAAMGGGPGDPRPGGRLFCDRDDPGDPFVDRRVGLLQQLNGLEVLAAPMDVRVPLPVLTGVVQVDHRGHGINSQAVNVELLEPVDRVGHQEVPHLRTTEVEDVRAPVRLVAAPRIRVLVQSLAVKAGEGEGILGEMRRNPVEQDANPVAVHGVHEVPEVIGRTEAGRWRVVARDLIAPGRTVGMFHHRHQLDMGEAKVLDVVDQVLGKAAIALALTPGAEMDLIDAHGSVVRVGRRTGGHPVAVLPGVCRGRHLRGARRRLLARTGHRVSLGSQRAVGAENLELVAVALGHVRYEQLPDAG